MKWNGPHDEDFFRCFEQYLDEAIKKFVQTKELRGRPQPLDCSPPETNFILDAEINTTGKKDVKVTPFEKARG